MRQFGYFLDKIIQVSLSFVYNLIIDERDGLIRNRGDEATRKAFNYGHSHFVELVKSAKNINFSIFITSRNMINYVFHESRASRLVAVNT